jgi:DNA-binding Lrp family transcriptional regulator
MQKPLDTPKLTRNDQEVLKNIILQAKTSDKEIAEKVGLTPQGVFKIRNKLEQLGIIKGYSPIIDFKKIGITVMAVLVIKLTSDVWDIFSDAQISERIKQIPLIISAYRVAEPDVTHILLMGFKSSQQMDNYLIKIQTKFSKEMVIKHIYSFSVDHVITESPIGLLYEILDKKEFPMDQFFLTKN